MTDMLSKLFLQSKQKAIVEIKSVTKWFRDNTNLLFEIVEVLL